jgi:hypothetical protein
MSAATPDYADILKRLERLERQRLALLFVSVLALAAAGTSVYLSRPTAAPGAVEAESIIFKDAQGRKRDSIKLHRSGSGLEFVDPAGVSRVQFGPVNGQDSEGWGLSLLGKSGAPLFFAVANDTKRSTIVAIGDDQGRSSINLWASSGHHPTLAFRDSNRNVGVGIDDDGISLMAASGKKSGYFGHLEFAPGEFVPGFILADANAKPRIMMEVNKNGPGLSITAENGATVFSKP